MTADENRPGQEELERLAAALTGLNRKEKASVSKLLVTLSNRRESQGRSPEATLAARPGSRTGETEDDHPAERARRELCEEKEK